MAYSKVTILTTGTFSLNNSQLKSINSTPITVVPNQGSGTVIVPIYTIGKFIYGGNNVFTGSNLQLFYATAAGKAASNVIISNTIMTSSTSQYGLVGSNGFATAGTIAQLENQSLVVSASSNFAGNAANDNTVNFNLYYYVVTL